MMLLNVCLLFMCILLSARPSTAINSYCQAGEDCNNEELRGIILNLQREAREADVLTRSTYENCTACFSEPCQNNGTCIPDGYHYRCECPANTSGTNCENIIECKSDSCGENATCFVAQHQTNCVCKLGFAGDDPTHAGCPYKVVQSCFSGDPHFVTFDKLAFDYQGTCPFVVSEPCNGPISGYPEFSVRAVNGRWHGSPTYAGVVSAQLITYNTDIKVNRNRTELLVNNVPTRMPYFLGDESNWRIHVYQIGTTAFIETNYNLKIEFSFLVDGNGIFCLTVPDIPAFQGPQTLCGLAGNRDGECHNDLRMRNGTVLPTSECAISTDSLMTEQYGDDWIVPNMNRGCILGTVLFNKTLPCDAQVLTDAGVACEPILDALNAVGVFSKCQGMGAEEIENYYRRCQWAQCYRGMQGVHPVHDGSRRCSAFMQFAHACQRTLPGTPLGEWRNSLSCPIYCPNPSSTYSDCAIGCPATCAAHQGTANCTQPCIEGCACNPGYVLDKGTCIALGSCSCFDGTTTHEANSVWYTDNCSVRKECHDGEILSQPAACDPNANCVTSDQGDHCICNAGYIGDGGTCTDIDECLNTTLCGQAQGQGSCTNTNGTYHCTCSPHYEGSDCQRFRPRRHCADLYLAWNDTASGIKTIYPSFSFNGLAINSPMAVYCNMDIEGGGWTAFTGPDGNSTVHKTIEDYEHGFGDVNANDYWLGLSFLFGATHEFSTTLRINLGYCDGNNTHWTYPDFSILDAAGGYAPVITTAGSGSAEEGWVMDWPEGRGPKFSGVDRCQLLSNTERTCCSSHGNTGWWFDSYMCGKANLNGIRFSCEHLLTNPEESIIWNFNKHPKSAQMLLRPKNYPNYDRPHGKKFANLMHS